MGDDRNLHVVAGTEFVSTAAASTDNHFPDLIDVRSPVVYQDFDVGADPFPAANQTLFHPFPDFQQMQSPIQMTIPSPEIPQYTNPSAGVSSPNLKRANNSHQPIRPWKRKNIKKVCQMTADELAADSWAWRKYGQKPIKGSRYPRNYYRCSTSKGCAARRQVERSTDAPGVYIVSYTGEHTHARSSQRSSRAGSSRGKVAAAAAVKADNGKNKVAATKAGSSTSRTMKGVAVVQKDAVYMAAEENDAGGEESTIPIPYDDLDVEEDVIVGFQNHPDCLVGDG